jgi:hypothetical protein
MQLNLHWDKAALGIGGAGLFGPGTLLSQLASSSLGTTLAGLIKAVSPLITRCFKNFLGGEKTFR